MDEAKLILFHIGPVQDFIRSSRRSRDLWFGSWLLSELSKTAALEIVEQNGGDLEWSLIFPAPETLSELKSDSFNVANRIVARTKKAPTELAEAVRAEFSLGYVKLAMKHFPELKTQQNLIERPLSCK